MPRAIELCLMTTIYDEYPDITMTSGQDKKHQLI